MLSLIGIYSNYFSEYPNGDKAQSIVHFFKGRISGGELLTEPTEESAELAFFKRSECPRLFNQQHQDCLEDFLNGSEGIYR